MLLRLGLGWPLRSGFGARTPIDREPAANALRALVGWNVRRVPLLALQGIVVPTVVGLARPMILLPASR
jgi:hypothetical protein